jgi:hypothetical protein
MLKSALQPFLKSANNSITGEGIQFWNLSNTTSFAFYNMFLGVADAGGGKVSAWNDALGTTARNASQATGANRPTITSNGVVFNGTTEFLFNNNPFMANSANGVMIVAVVSAPNSTASAEWSISEASTSSTIPNLGLLSKDNLIIDYGKITQAMRNDANTNILTYGGNSGGSIAFDNTFKIICHNLDKSTGFVTTWINGVIESPPLAFALSGSFTMNRFSIGCLSRATNLNFWSGTYKGIAILDALVSEADRQRAEGYLAHLYTQTALLPVDHPYKTTPPLI